jgi:hypothetical protein
MILTAHQPVYLPWLGLFHKIALSDAYCYFDDVQYQRQEWNNRNRIKGSNGVFWITVPVMSKSRFNRKISDIEIDNAVNWCKKHLKSIESCYKKAPFFNQYYDFFHDCYNRQWTHLSELNEYMLKWFLDILNIKVKYYRMSDMGLSGNKDGLVLDACKKINADMHIFGEQGRNYVDSKIFEREGIKIYFQKYRNPFYFQLHGRFEPNLSIVDLLFNVGADKAMDVIMRGNITKEELEKDYKRGEPIR